MKVLMCPPLHYEPAPGEDGAAVMAEWRGLYRLLREELDVQVDLIGAEARPMPKLVLAASGGFVWKDSFIASRPRDLPQDAPKGKRGPISSWCAATPCRRCRRNAALTASAIWWWRRERCSQGYRSR